MKEEWIVGKNAVLEALRTEKPINKIWIADSLKPGTAAQIEHHARRNKLVVQRVPRGKIEAIAEKVNHQGVIAFVPPTEYADLDDVLQRVSVRGDSPFFIVLDGIEDPYNLGSILRTADAVGAHAVIIPNRRAAGLTAAVAKASAGAVHHVPVVRVTNIPKTIDRLKKEGVWVCGTAADAPQDYRQASYDLPLAIVVGNEGKGMSRLVGERCDFHVHLPITGQIQSLNASVAAALIMYEVYRSRNPLS